MALTDADIDYIESQLKQTTVGGTNKHWKWPPPANATFWHNAYARLESGRTPVTPPTTTRIDCFPGDWASVNKQLVDGSAVQLRSGVHPMMEMTKTFAADKRVSFYADADAVVNGGFLLNGVGGYAFLGPHARILSTDVDTGSISPRVFNIQGAAHDILIQHCKIEGGYTAIYPYANGTYIKNLEIRDNDIFGSWGDLIHTEYVDGLIIDHNVLHDPRHLTSEHHDGWQPVSTKNAKFTRNIVSWLNGEGHYTGQTASYLGQGMMLSGMDHGDKNANFEIYGNLIHHYNGRPINMNGVVGCKVANNTLVDSGDGISITFGAGCSGVEVWNNIQNYQYVDAGGTPPAYSSNNWNIRDNGDPGFIDKTLYHLAANSPARGKGIDRGGVPAVDLNGTPVSSATGMGCWHE